MGGKIISESGGGFIPLQGGAIIPELGGGFLRNQHAINPGANMGLRRAVEGVFRAMKPEDEGINLLRRSGGVVGVEQKPGQRKRPGKIKERGHKDKHKRTHAFVVGPKERFGL
jgi:hypothetical protein